MPPTQYDPANPQPYEAPKLPDVVTPTIQNAEQQQQNFAPNIQRGPMNQLGGWAELGDNLFRGLMRGKAEHTVNQAVTFKKQDDALQASYSLAAQNLKTMHDNGVDPNSDQYKQAVSAVQGSWGALMQFRGSHIPGMDDPGMKGKKKKSKDGQPNILEQLGSNDPMQQVQGAYAAMMKLGPPVMYQLGDPKKIQQDKQIADLQRENALTAEQKEHRINELQMKQNLTPDEQQELVRLSTKPVQPVPGDEKLKAQDAIYSKIRQDPEYQLTDNDRTVLGLGPKTQVHVTSRGEVIATSETADGQGSYQVLRGPQDEYEPKGAGKNAPQKKIPADITNNKNKAFVSAQQQYLHGDPDSDDPKKKKLTFDEFAERIQAAQDTYQQRVEDVTGEPVEHLNVRDYLTDGGGWNWHGKKPMAETAGVPDSLRGQKPSAGVSTSGQEELGLPPDIAKQLKPGFISTLSDGSRWTIRNGKPKQISTPQQ